MNNLPRTMNTAPRTNRLSSLTCQSIMTSIMQNKPNFRKAQMNVSYILKRNYKNFIPLAGYKNKPNSNPIKALPACPEFIEGSAFILSFVEVVEWANFRNTKMNVNLTLTKDYRKKDDFVVRKNKPNFFKGQK